MISQRTLDLIIECEVTSRKQYEKKYHCPEWPGGGSGVTIGIGYDLAFSNATKLHTDFDGLIPAKMISVLERCLGVRGQAAAELLSSVRNLVSVPWDAAVEVFMNRDIPDWTKRVCDAIPGASKLSPDCLGVLVSLAYNRGASFNNQGDRYREMRQIKAHIVSGNLYAVADDLRSMKRLWPDLRGLQVRREAEAKLWELGLSKPAAAVKTPNAAEEPKTTLKASIPEGAVAGACAAGAVTTATAVQGVHWGWILLGVILTVAVFIAIREINAKPTIARQKDTP